MFRRGRKDDEPGTAGEIAISWQDADGRPLSRRFATAVRVGREPDNDLCLPHSAVSRRHVEIVPGPDGWSVRDLGSSNGTYLDGQRIGEAVLPARARLQLGVRGPVLELARAEARRSPPAAPSTGDNDTAMSDRGDRRRGWFGGGRSRDEDEAPQREPEPLPPLQGGGSSHYRRPAAAVPGAPVPVAPVRGGDREPDGEGAGASRHSEGGGDSQSRDEIQDRYFSAIGDEEVGDHTRAVRFVFREHQKKQRRRWLLALGGVGVLLFGAVGGLIWQSVQEDRARALAIDLFYDMKAIEVELGRLETAIRATGEEQLIAQLGRNREQMRQMRARYDSFIHDAGLIDTASLDDVDALILRVARVFGECELDMPPGFVAEVKTYIQKWKATDRLESALRDLERRGELDVVARAMIDQGLPPQFLYLGLQESNFNARAIGPETRWGIAKGAWQFIPTTGQEYGLRIGPLAGQRVHDPADDRFDFNAATNAAARFLRDIYNTDAQASGLLVMASYNWGPHRVNERVRQLPENPRERNFWAFLQQNRIPEETYNYVFYIVSAAVIGENPRLFGFDFDNPLRAYAQSWN